MMLSKTPQQFQGRSHAPKDSGSSNGTGKVDFDCQETAERAIRDLNGSNLDGAQITVQSLADVPLHYWWLGRTVRVGRG